MLHLEAGKVADSVLPAFLVGVLLLGVGFYFLLFEVPSTVPFHVGGVLALIGLFPFGIAMKEIMK